METTVHLCIICVLRIVYYLCITCVLYTKIEGLSKRTKPSKSQYLCGFLSRFGLTVPLSGALLTMGLEITAGVTQCIYWHLPVYFLAFGLGFSGVCIHLQIFSFFHKAGLPLSKTRYVLARFLNGLLSAAFYLLLSYFLPASTSVAVETSPLNTAPMTGSAASSLALIALSVFFLLTCILRSGKTPSKICGGNSTGKMLQ